LKGCCSFGNSVLVARLRHLIQGSLSVINDFLFLGVDLVCPFPHVILSGVIVAQSQFMSIVPSTSPDFSIVEQEQRMELASRDLNDPVSIVLIRM
jgi:hypothetical protein